MHVEDAKRHEHGESDHFLHDFQLWQRKLIVADSVGRNHDEVFEQSNSPANQRGNKPLPSRHVSQVSVPRKSHEDIGDRQKKRGLNDWWNNNEQLHTTFA